MKTPKELSLPNPDWPDPAELVRELEKLGATKGGAQVFVEIPAPFVKATITVATNAWRLRTRLIDRHSGEIKEDVSKEDVKKMARYIESIYEAFAEIGIEIKDRTGEAFDYGLPEKVVTAQPQEGLTRERIIETLRPTIYWKEKLAQQGEVTIATPIEASA
jgi:hypothetical protein